MTQSPQASKSQISKANLFKSLHQPGAPLVLYNIWDAGSAQAVAKAGAAALATGSWPLAAAQGYADGQAIPLDDVLAIARRIIAVNDLPLSVDFEGGYSADPAAIHANATKLMATGAIGVNFEDRVVGGEGLYDVATQAHRIAAIRAAAETAGVPLFINARTDTFFRSDADTPDPALTAQAVERAQAFADAGADGLFVPFLSNPAVISEICSTSPLPVNVLATGADAPIAPLAELGVARVSFGPAPYRAMMHALTEVARPYYAE